MKEMVDKRKKEETPVAFRKMLRTLWTLAKGRYTINIQRGKAEKKRQGWKQNKERNGSKKEMRGGGRYKEKRNTRC